MEKKKKKLSLAVWILISMILGIVAGICFLGNPEFTTDYIKPIGSIFVNLLKFIVVPIVLLSIICGMISMKDIKKVGSIGWKTIVYYLCTTAVAIIIGLVLANIFKGAFPTMTLEEGAVYDKATSANIMDTIVNIFPSNIITPLSSANMLQVIVIALFIGAGIIMAGIKGKACADFVESCNEVMMKVMMFIINLSPIGVFCMMTWVIATQGPEILGNLAIVLLVAYLGYVLHAVIVYSAAVRTMGGMSPLKFFKGMLPAMIFAFSSTSSVATIPLTEECATNLGANDEVTSFIIPLGATINMDGTAIYMGVNTIFLAVCAGIDLSIGDLLVVVLTATIASIGTAGVSGAGMIMLAMVLTSVGIPVEYILIIYGIDRLFDMGRTTINIVGDASCAIVVSKFEKRKEEKQKRK